MLEDGTEYFGYYHKYITGEVYTHSNYNEDKSKKLVPMLGIKVDSNFSGYVGYNINNNQVQLLKYKQPEYKKRIITDDEYKVGWIERYFIKKRNDVNSKIIEINKIEFDSLDRIGTGIDGFLYKGISLKWRIAGDLTKVIEINKKTVISNLRSFSGLQNILYDFSEYFKK